MAISNVQINLVLSVLLIILMMHSYYKMNQKIETNRLFSWMMGSTLSVLLLEALSVILNNPNHIEWIGYHKLVNVLGFALSPVIPFIGYLFIIKWINRFTTEKRPANWMLLIPIIINGFVAILSYKWGFLFHVTTSNVYERGQVFFLLPLVCYWMFGYNLFILYKNRKMLTYSELIVLSSFYIVPSIFTMIQLKYASILTSWNGAAIVVVMTYVFILNDQIYRDNLTGLENRMAYDHYLQNLDRRNPRIISMLFIDIDNLKIINDNYGHTAGDELLRGFANLLRDSFPLTRKLIRFGGDEFLVIIEEKNHQRIDQYIDRLLQKTKEANLHLPITKSIEFSYGLVYRETNENLEHLLKRADALMYLHKGSKNKV